MIPTGIEYHYTRKPVALIGLIAANVLIFLAQSGMSESTLSAIVLWPDRLAPWQWITSSLLHGGWEHLLGNMLFLFVYGRYLEERLGPVKFLLLWPVLASAASLVYIAANYGGETPALGASGVISGLMGIVLVVAPMSQVRLYWGYRFVWRAFHLPAFLVLGLWVLEQAALGLGGIETGIAISAHLGGFGAGAILGALFRSPFSVTSGWHLDPAVSTNENIRQSKDERMWRAIADHHRDKDVEEPPGAAGHRSRARRRGYRDD